MYINKIYTRINLYVYGRQNQNKLASRHATAIPKSCLTFDSGEQTVRSYTLRFWYIRYISPKLKFLLNGSCRARGMRESVAQDPPRPTHTPTSSHAVECLATGEQLAKGELTVASPLNQSTYTRVCMCLCTHVWLDANHQAATHTHHSHPAQRQC